MESTFKTRMRLVGGQNDGGFSDEICNLGWVKRLGKIWLMFRESFPETLKWGGWILAIPG